MELYAKRGGQQTKLAGDVQAWKRRAEFKPSGAGFRLWGLALLDSNPTG
jgi:hypothetical protein